MRFHREVYAGTAVDEAVKVWSAYADFELSESEAHWVVKVTPKHEGDAAKQIVGEFGNYVLGLTVDRGGADAGGEA